MHKEDIPGAVEKWLGGNESAYESIFRYYYQRLLSFAVRFLKDRTLAEELTMNTLLKVWQNRATISAPNTFHAYVFVILRNELVSYSRKKKPFYVPVEGFENLWKADSPEAIQASREILEQYQRCLFRLPPKRREVFLLSREEGLTHAEIADKLGISVFTVKNHIKAALQSFKAELSHPVACSFLYGMFLLESLHRL